MSKLLEAFIAFERETRDRLGDHNTLAVPVGTRLQRIIRNDNGWQLWLSTRDYKHGTYYLLNNDGSMQMVVARPDEGDEITNSRPSDDEIRRQSSGKANDKDG